MNRLFAILILSLTGCASSPPSSLPQTTEYSPSLPSIEEIPEGHFAIFGVQVPGFYPIEEDEAMMDAIRAAGGPAICEVCFNDGGEARLWANLAGPLLTRKGERFKFSRKGWENVPVLEGDFIYFDHIPF